VKMEMRSRVEPWKLTEIDLDAEACEILAGRVCASSEAYGNEVHPCNAWYIFWLGYAMEMEDKRRGRMRRGETSVR
jgi:hypothetical protein